MFPARSAKERKVRIWKDYVAPTANLDQKDRQFVAKVSPPADTSRFTAGTSLSLDHLAPIKSRRTATLSLTLTTVTQVTEEPTRTFNGRRNQPGFMKGVWTNAL